MFNFSHQQDHYLFKENKPCMWNIVGWYNTGPSVGSSVARETGRGHTPHHPSNKLSWWWCFDQKVIKVTSWIRQGQICKKVSHVSRVYVKQILVHQGIYREQENSHFGWPNHTDIHNSMGFEGVGIVSYCPRMHPSMWILVKHMSKRASCGGQFPVLNRGNK